MSDKDTLLRHNELLAQLASKASRASLECVRPSGTLKINTDGSYDVSKYAAVKVNVLPPSGTGTNTLTIYATGTCYAPDTTHTHAISVQINSEETEYYTVYTSYDGEYGVYSTATVCTITTLSEEDSVVLFCENVRTDRTPVTVDSVGCDVTVESIYDYESAEYNSNRVTITNVTDGATVTIIFDADY